MSKKSRQPKNILSGVVNDFNHGDGDGDGDGNAQEDPEVDNLPQGEKFLHVKQHSFRGQPRIKTTIVEI